MALQRIGAKSSITALTDGTPNAIKANTVWEYIRDEVLEAVKPKFATVRVALAQSATLPANAEVYDFAYPLPVDYLCLADDSKDDPNVWPDTSVKPYVIETLADGTVCVMTNYDSVTEDYDIFLTYVRKVVDPAKYYPSFINALAFRLAAELALTITESGSKYEAMTNLYIKALKKAKAASRAQDYIEDEKGSDSYETAGR
jgi:hypothetical protein